MQDEYNLHFNAIGEVDTAKEAHDDFMAVVDAFCVGFPEEIANLQFEFSYDVASKD